jgi:integrase/recombinase XerD
MAHSWLRQAQVKKITKLYSDDLECKRDWIIFRLLLGAGLRREEMASLTFDALKQQPTKKGMHAMLDVRGKGAKDRVIPIQPLLAERLRAWKMVVGQGFVACPLGMKKQIGKSMSAVAVFHLVRKYGKLIDMPNLDPHDLRRTFAQLAYQAGIPITQISILLGHSNIAATQRYLDLAVNGGIPASKFVPLSGD